MDSKDGAAGRSNVRRSTILVAEDNAVNQDLIRRQLQRLGHQCDIAASGDQALETWRTGEYRVLLTDLRMPGLDGYQLARRIREEERQRATRTAIYAISANDADPDQACDTFDGFIAKPISTRELSAAIEVHLDHSAIDEPQATSPGVGTTAAGEPGGDLPVLDVTMLIELIGDDPSDVLEFLQQFRDSVMADVARLESAFDRNDLGEVENIAHRIKSAARSVGALQMGELCALIEKQAARKSRDCVNQYARTPSRSLAVVTTAIESYLGGRAQCAATPDFD